MSKVDNYGLIILTLTHPHGVLVSLMQQEDDEALSLMFWCRFSIFTCPKIGLASC